MVISHRKRNESNLTQIIQQSFVRSLAAAVCAATAGLESIEILYTGGGPYLPVLAIVSQRSPAAAGGAVQCAVMQEPTMQRRIHTDRPAQSVATCFR